MMREAFGRTGEGEPVERVTIRGGGLSANILTWGCVIQDLRLDGHDAPLVLGFEAFEHYPAHSPYFGATAGRYANRIRDGRFSIDGTEYQVDTNFLGKHLLHGGIRGIGKRVWTIADLGQSHVTLVLDDKDGMMGFPGNCLHQASFALEDGGRLAVRMQSQCDRPTLVNLAHHSCFNLDGGSDILDHQVAIAADGYIPVDEEAIPLGPVEPVAGTAFDFRKARPIRHECEGNQVRYDHNFCLSRDRVDLREVAWVESPVSGIRMIVETSEPGLQFYAGHKVNVPVPGLGGRSYGAYCGFCMEPQIWPDSPNHPDYPQAVLRPGETYRQETGYRFSRG